MSRKYMDKNIEGKSDYKNSSYETYVRYASIFSGIAISAYSSILRILAQAHKVNYSYMQSVGLHWGFGIIGGTIVYSKTKKPLLSAAVVSGVGAFLEGVQHFYPGIENIGTGTLEDIVGNVCGAIIGSFAPKYIPKMAECVKSKYANYKNSKSLDEKL